eukprot:SAG11_NODE_10332_length_839_cov_0.991892_1_plen_30_part_10
MRNAGWYLLDRERLRKLVVEEAIPEPAKCV